MAWSAYLERSIVIEGDSLLAVVTYTDGLNKSAGVRVTGDSEGAILTTIAGRVAELDAQAARSTSLQSALAAVTIAPGLIALPDISKIKLAGKP
jgi:hypothetical protein